MKVIGVPLGKRHKTVSPNPCNLSKIALLSYSRRIHFINDNIFFLDLFLAVKWLIDNTFSLFQSESEEGMTFLTQIISFSLVSLLSCARSNEQKAN